MSEFTFHTYSMKKLDSEQLMACSKLFSEHYGKYENSNFVDEERRGRQVRLGPKYYKDNYCGDDFYIALVKDGSRHIAHAIYLRKKLSDGQIMTWVVQLVVDTVYRGNGIGRKLLNSIWGFSNDAAWGLATSNPYTVKTLEASTFRKVKSQEIIKHLDEIKEIGQFVKFADGFKVDENTSVVNSKFFVDHSDVEINIENTFEAQNWILGKLDSGYEWLAFTFQEQEFADEYDEAFVKLMDFSEQRLREAYGRMESNQGWEKFTRHETEFLMRRCHLKEGSVVLDFGCGKGRHARALAQEGVKVTGIYFAQNFISCNENTSENLQFYNEDCRYFKSQTQADTVIALYDVVGSFQNDEDNEKIIANAYANLRQGGYFVLSVMNMALTKHLAKKENIGVFEDNLKQIQALPPSDTMQKTGNVFKPEYYFLDNSRGLVYRKEQFYGDDDLQGEYIIRDRRYTKKELQEILEKNGFEVLDIYCTQLGNWNKKLNDIDIGAKEILAVCRKTER